MAAHYIDGIARVRALGLACEPSIKLTQLGLDIDREFAYAHALRLARAAHDAGSYFWVDMEQSSYVDVTLDIVRRLREEVPARRRVPAGLSDAHQRGPEGHHQAAASACGW